MERELIKEENPLWFVEESTDMMTPSQGGLAGYIFELVDKNITDEQESVMRLLKDSSPIISELVKGMKKSERLQLVLSDEMKQKIADGTYKFMKKKDVEGIFKAVVVDQNGKIKSIAELKWEEITEGVDLTKITSAMQGIAIQHQLKEIACKLEEMSEVMEGVIIGQHNDRLAMFLSGEAIYREALSTSDLSLRKSLTSSALLALTNASSSLQASLVYEVKGVCEKYDAEKGRFVGVKSEKLKEKMFLINSAFQTIHKSNTLKAAIYYKEGEYAAVATVLSEYKAFLERILIGETAHILYLADSNAKTFDGIWNIRQNQLPEKINNVKMLLGQPQYYMLETDRGGMV